MSGPHMKTGKLLIRIFIVVTLLSTITACGNSGSEITYVAIGASDANGVGADPITRGYVYRIQNDISDRGKDTGLINLGIPGAGVVQMRDVEAPLAKKADPDLVTVFAGGNDLVGGKGVADFEGVLSELLDELRNETDAFIVIATLPDATKAPKFVKEPSANVTRARLDGYNAAILRQAARHAIPVADLRDIGVGTEVTAGDGFHPNEEGYAIIAQQFLKIVVPQFFPGENAS